MNAGRLSIKRIAVSKDQARIVLVIALSASIIAFCLVASRVLISKMTHQSRVIDAKKDTLNTLEINISEVDKLQSSYLTFENASESVLGNPGEKNSRVILDSLPSKYDFAAVLTSIEKILQEGVYEVERFEGLDKEIEAIQESSNPEPVEVPVSLTVITDYPGAWLLVSNLDRSIRPMNIKSINFSGSDDNLKIQIELLTYYQPEKKLDISKQEIK